MQEAYLRAWANFRRFENVNFHAWICQILINKFQDNKRREAIARGVGNVNLSPPEEDTALKIDIENAMKTLTIRERRVVEKLLEGQTRKEIAESEGFTKTRTHSRIDSARKKIKDYLDA